MRLIIPVVILLLLLLSIVGYSAPVMKGDAQAVQEVQAAMREFGGARTWRARIAGGGLEKSVVVEYVAPNRFHVGDPQEGLFVVGLQLWEQRSGKCVKSKGPDVLIGLILLSKEAIVREGVAGGVIATITAQPGPTEMVEGTPTRTYALVVETAGDPFGQTIREKLYVTIATGLPRRIEMQYRSGPMTIDYFDFGVAIVINDPPC